MKKSLLLFSFFIIISNSFSQDNESGYWDNSRATYKTIKLAYDKKTWVRTDELPIGTTEIMYRITLLNDKQELLESLSSLVNKIPPNQYSTSVAIATTLASKVVSNDLCKFSIFNTYDDAQNYYKTGNYQTACYSYPNSLHQYAGRFSIENSDCLNSETRYLWFGFKNKNEVNIITDETIVLEVIPWVNKKASTGWSLEFKQKIIDVLKENDVVKKLSDPDKFSDCVLNKLEENYTVQDFKQLTFTERTQISNQYIKLCFDETGETDKVYEKASDKANSLIKNKKYSDAIKYLLDIIDNKKATIRDYSNIGYCYLITKQFLKSIKYLKIGESIDETDLSIKLNLAHAYLFSDDIENAKAIYAKYKKQNINENVSWIDAIQKNFDDFKSAGLTSEYLNEVLNIIR
ncbi:MAG TPA: hypothetical protein PK431_04930 [Chitinophagales bacterium]|nr:hypothetical protein [Chitinophagales bacterium]